MLTGDQKEAFLKAMHERFPSGTADTKQIKAVVHELGLPAVPSFIWKNRLGNGVFSIPAQLSATRVASARVVSLPKRPAPPPVPVEPAPEAATKFDPNAQTSHTYAEVPTADDFFVPFGDFSTVTAIVRSTEFFPVYVSGMSGCGKTLMIEQSCARLGRAMTRVQMSRETDEDDLIGGFRLINGETKFVKGPVIRAMELGSILLIDEADRADPTKIMCIQGILEGKPYYIKKTGEVVYPRPGFNVFVTANTLGRGGSDGRYSAATILDDALLERFPVTIPHEFPNESIEKRILSGRLCGSSGCSVAETAVVDDLVKWATIIRKTFEEDGIDETISTRRLVHIVNTYRLVGKIDRAIELCVNRFDEETRSTLTELWARVKRETQGSPVPDQAGPVSADPAQ